MNIKLLESIVQTHQLTASIMRTSLLFLFLSLSFLSFSQSTTSLLDFNQQRLQRQRTAMLVLGSWAVANIGAGLALRGDADGENRYWHDMNAGWNAVNLAIAGLGYWSTMRTDPASFDLASTLAEQHKLQKILLFNAGLDIAYMLGGAYLIERAKNDLDRRDQLRGFGKSIILQGGFLFAFDLVTYYVHAKHNADLSPMLQGLSLSGQGIGWRLSF